MEDRLPLSKPALWLIRAWSYLPLPSLYAYFLWNNLVASKLSEISLLSWFLILTMIIPPFMHISKVRNEEIRSGFDRSTANGYVRTACVMLLGIIALVVPSALGLKDPSRVKWPEIVLIILALSLFCAPGSG
jgi:hypothetical protein